MTLFGRVHESNHNPQFNHHDKAEMSTAKPQVKRTYGSQIPRTRIAAKESSLGTSSSSPPSVPDTTLKRKRPLADLFLNNSPPKRIRTSCKSSALTRADNIVKKAAKKETGLTQLHFCIDQSTLRSCPLCDLTYTRGSLDDENLHKAHCSRVQKGMEWGREENKDTGWNDGTCTIIEEDIVLASGERGRIVAIKPAAGRKLGTKLSSYLKTVNLALSAPDMPAPALKLCKAYLFLLRTPGCSREKIVGCIVAQRISEAMEVATAAEVSKLANAGESLVHVEGNLYCKPKELPTAMGIPRLFVSSAHRRKGIAKALLDGAARTFIHGCELDPGKGEIAFSQPTSMGRTVMEKWGSGGISPIDLHVDPGPFISFSLLAGTDLYRRGHALLQTFFSDTAAAVKPAAHNLGKWDRPRSAPTESKYASIRKPDPENRSGLSNDSMSLREIPDIAPSYQPNLSKWTRQEPLRTPKKARLEGLEKRTPNRRRQVEEDNSNRLSKSATSQQIPKFPEEPASRRTPHDLGSSGESGLQRDPAPHLVSRQEETQDSERSSSSAAAAERDVGLGESQGSTKSEAYPEPVVSEYTETYETEFIGQDGRYKQRRSRRENYKERGSVIQRLQSGENIEIPYHSRTHRDHLGQAKRHTKKPKEKLVAIDVAIPSIVSVENLSRLLDVRLETLQDCMYRNGMEELSSHDHILSSGDASLLAMEFNRNPVIDDNAAFDIYAAPPHPEPATLPRRPPIVTIMGHVDHGKTTLLDTLRSSSVAKGEAGGITQHIGAFSVPVRSTLNSPDSPHSITFLDTPGHAAFSAMRARGAQVTDIIVLVVAADDGVMPQTKEVINLIKKEKGKVGVVVAINKVDKPGVDVSKVQNDLWAEGIELEVMGGDVPSVEVSGLTGHGLENLIETISLLSELQDIRAETDGLAHGYVLESKVTKGFGNTATVLLTRGRLAPSSHIISGTTYAKVRRLMDFSGATIKEASPGTAVVVSGWKELPSAGDEVLQGKENDIKLAVENRKCKASLAATLEDVEAINAARRHEREERERKANENPDEAEQRNVRAPAKESGPRELRLVLKGDVSGSVEALAAAVQAIGNKDAVTKVISTGVGEVTESDVMLAKAAEGMVIAFCVNVPRVANQVASQNKVPVSSSNVIYKVLDEVKERVVKLLPRIVEKRVTGEAKVLEIFDITGKAKSIIKVAGCRVSNGIIEKNKQARVLRGGETVHDGTLSALRILKREVLEVKKGLECGISLNDFNDLRAGDHLQFYEEVEKLAQL
ncbi:initiation factor 2 [Sanghuangporus baumii]|uniref:Translation initiation factor IF-2, mitochondrial n=1 Tax=Sanghuangporus baumii TaxID=108892 RepID=A0A9Q5N856_SANBA|nr:initiation factor 2 [Sanghuangporus baumii]